MGGGPPPQTPKGSKNAIFYIGKVPVCKNALRMFLGIGMSRMDRLLAHARQGGVTPPVDGRSAQPSRESDKTPEWFDADSWFCWTYHNIAEFIATTRMKETSLKAIEDLVPELSDFTADGKQRREAHAARTDPSAPCHDVAQQLSDIEKLPVKFMHPASLATLYELYKHAVDESDRSMSGPAKGSASRSTWYRVYRNWSVVLKMRSSTSRHAGCSLCSRIKRFRAMAKTRKQGQLVSRAYAIHQSRVMRDRATFGRLFSSSEAYCRDGNVGATPVVALQLDAMDHAKFKAPRLANPCKETEALWRPSLQMIGGTTWGVSESWFLFDITLRKDANMQCTVMGIMLDEAHRALTITMPPRIFVNTDNTAAETKHITCFVWAAYLVGVVQKVNSVAFGQGQVGHTHNEEDQRFSTCVQLLSKRCQRESLQCPDDFLKAMQQLKPIRGREQDARVLTASRDWHRFFEEHLGNLTGLLKGHGESKWTKLRGEEAQHSWVFVRRDALDSEDPENIAGLVINNAWGTDAHPGDVILLTRLYISDPEFHGVEVFLPAEKLALLPQGGPDYMSDRNALTNRHCHEFMKTASALEKFPLKMKRGAEYLRTLVRESTIIESGGDPPPWQLPPLGWVAGRYTDAEDGIDPDLCSVDDGMACAVDSHLRPTRPQMVSIHPNALLHNRKHRITGKRRLPHVSEGHGAPARNLEPSAPPGAGILVQATGAEGLPTDKGKGRGKRIVDKRAKAKAKASGPGAPDAAPPADSQPAKPVPRGNRSSIDFAKPPEPDDRLGCATCRNGRRGCAKCRKRKGMVVRDGRWAWPLAGLH